MLKKIAITGAAGQISYSLLFRLASGELFGPKVPVSLRLLDLPQAQKALQGVVMELRDAAFPLLEGIEYTDVAEKAFEDVDLALLVGSKPRGPGMERADLLKDNGAIFVSQGKALNQVAKKEVKVVVVGNPCNTNCLIAAHHAPDLKKENFYAMTRLDLNRLRYQIAKRAGVWIEEVKNSVIWGNHSATQVPDFYHATIQGKPCLEVLNDEQELLHSMVPCIQKRGASIIEYRGKSSAASAASALIDAAKDIFQGCESMGCSSSAVFSQGNPYGIDEQLFYSFPLTFHQERWRFVQDLSVNPTLEKMIRESEKELIEEREAVAHLLT